MINIEASFFKSVGPVAKRLKLLRYFNLIILVLLTSCGFHSIYGTEESERGLNNLSVAQQLNHITIENIPDRSGQMLRNDLIDSLYGKGRPTNPLYKLTIGVHSTEEDLGIQANSTSTRSLLNMYADYSLTGPNQKSLVKGRAHSVASFNKLSQQYGTQSARDDAIERTINEVSNQIVNRLSLYFRESEKN